MRSLFLLFAPVLAAAQAAPKEHAPETCPTPAAPLPAGLTAWKTGPSLAAATDRNTLARTRLTVGRRIELMLAPSDTVRYPFTPAKPGEPTSLGGMASFSVARAGTYRVMLGTPAWIDVVKGRKAQTSTAHAHGAACSGIAKMVDFKLTPGRYTLQIAGSKAAAAPVLITNRP
ncbi:hypothetical protein [Sphingomonas sp. PAMC 26605]|uniref:hypothetical protein n=1 Tax=Sphingomonas sp. PAMC 26605 TaxID=1112214 RepID=UPI00026CABD5|nr:hypothetical protein [Sphingomonas sp. PAMC 26605]